MDKINLNYGHMMMLIPECLAKNLPFSISRGFLIIAVTPKLTLLVDATNIGRDFETF